MKLISVLHKCFKKCLYFIIMQCVMLLFKTLHIKSDMLRDLQYEKLLLLF